MGFDSSAKNYLKSSDHAVGDDLSFFSEYFKNVRFTRALDVACAAGHFGNAFPADMVYTSDLSFNMLKTARESFRFEMPAMAKGEFLPYLPDSFDLVGCRIAMHHFMSPCMFMNEVYRILRTGGCFALIDSVVGMEDAELNRIELIRDETHRRSFRVEEIIGMAEAEGFTAEHCEVFLKVHKFEEWARRLNPSEEQYDATKAAFLALPPKVKKELRLETNGDTILSYTDKKAVFIFKK